MPRKLKISERNRTEAGQNLVELAIGMIIILIILSGIIDLGRAFISYQSLREAAQEGAIFASIHPLDTAGIEARARGTSQQPVPLADTTLVTVNTFVINAANGQRYPAGSASSLLCQGNLIEVEVRYDHTITTAFIGGIVGSQQIELVASSTDTILRPECP